MKRSFLAIILFFIFPCFSYADIKGRVINDQYQPIEGIALILSDSSGNIILRTTITDKDGHYTFSLDQVGIYLLSVKSAIYNLHKPQLIDYITTVTLPDIVLQSVSKQLKEVNVSNQKPLIEMKAGKIIVNVDQSITAAASSVFDLLQRSPNVSIDNNDRIALKGRQGVQIMIDGKTMVVQGNELLNLLKSMPASTLDKIELMSNPGAQYDAAGTAGIINLKTKKEKRQGYNGTAQLGLGQGVYTKSNAGLNLNYRKNKINIFLNSNLSLRKGFNQLDLDRIFLRNADYNGSYKQDNYAIIRLQNYSLNTGLDYTINNKTTIGFVASANRTSYTFDGENNGQLYDSNRLYRSYFLSNNHQKNSGSSVAFNANLRHAFDSLGRTFSFDADYASFIADNDQTQMTNYFLPNGSEEKPKYIMDGELIGFTDIKAIKSDYVHPLNVSSKFEVGIKISAVTADNKPDFYDASNGSKIFDSSKSNHFIYHENISAAYINYSKDWEKWSIQAGLRYEHTRAKGEQRTVLGESFDRNYGQLFPNIVATYNASEKHQFSISISRRIDRPNYEQLNPFKNYIDPTSIHQGNPYLNPSFSYTLEIAHAFKNRFSTSFGIAQTNDVITQVIILDNDKITLVTDRNLATNRVFSLNCNYPFGIAKWWTSIASTSFYYSIYEGNLSNTPLQDGIPTAYLSSNNSFTLHKNWSAELNSWFSSDQRYGYMYLRPMYAINLGIQKHFWNKTATLKISFNDIFRAQNPIGITEFSNYRESFVVTRDTRTINCNFTYRFGNSKIQRQRRAGGADEERRRAGSGTQAT